MPALEALRQKLNNSDLEVTARAKACIARIERDAKSAALVKALKDPKTEERAKAAEKLIGFDYSADIVMPALLEALDDIDSKVQERALGALVYSKRAVPKVVQILRNSKAGERLRYLAAWKLRMFGPAAQESVPDLLYILSMEGPVLRCAAAQALGNIGATNKDIVPALVKALNDKDSNVQSAAAGALGIIHKDATTVVPALIEVLRKANGTPLGRDRRYKAAVGALKMFGAEAKPAIPFLVKIAQNPQEDHMFLFHILQALRAIGPAAEPELEKLKALAYLHLLINSDK